MDGQASEKRVIELSCDLGEASSPEEQAIEDALWPLISAVNVACGGHVGDAESMKYAVDQAARYGVALGAHPSYPDRVNFGRRSMALERHDLRESLLTQLDALAVIAASGGVSLDRVKPHGALYNDLHDDSDLATTVVEAIREIGQEIRVTASPNSQLSKVARERGAQVIAEAFADRRYRRDGSLVPRSEPDALLLDIEEASGQALHLARERSVVANDGTVVPIEFATLCIHGDMAGSVERAMRIRARLIETGFALLGP